MAPERRLQADQSYIADTNSTLKILTLNNGIWLQIEMFSGVDDLNLRSLRVRAAGGPPFIIINTLLPPGPNAIDVGFPALPSTWYYVYIIGDSNGVLPTAGLLSTNLEFPFGPGPLMPPGYDIKRRIGSVKTDGAGQLMDFRKFGQFVLYDIYYKNLVHLGAVPLAVTPVAVSSFVPLIAERCLLLVELWDNVGAPTEFISVYGETLGPAPIGPTFQLTAATLNPGISQVNSISAWVHTGGNIYIAGTGNPASLAKIYVLGYWEDTGPMV